LSWTSDGKYLATCGVSPSGSDSNDVRVYQFTAPSTLTEVASALVGITSLNICVIPCKWSPNNQYLAVGATNSSDGYNLKVYAFNGSSLTLLPGACLTSTDISQAEQQDLAWSPNGQYLAVGVNGSQQVRLYGFNGTTLTRIATYTSGAGSFSMAFNSAGTQFFNGSVSTGNDGYYLRMFNMPSILNTDLKVYACTLGSETVPQAYTNSIVFGNSAFGSSNANLNVKVLSGAHIEINGMMLDDSV
jgi:WD40 repeat protein